VIDHGAGFTYCRYGLFQVKISRSYQSLYPLWLKGVMKSEVLKYIPVNIANILISFGTITILTRILSAAEFGRYALVLTTLNFVHMGVFTWLEASMARFHERAEVENRLTTHFKTLYLSAIYVGVVATVLILALIYSLPLDDRLRLLLTFALINTAVHLIYGLTIESHKAAHRISRYSAIHSTQLILSFGLGIILIMLTPLNEAGPFIGMLIGGSIAIAVELPTILARSRGGTFDKKIIREYFFYGGPISFTLVLGYALANGDLYFIRYFMNDEAVGAYSAGYNFANSSLHYLFLWLSMAVMPIAITTMERQGTDYATKVLFDYGNVLVIMTMPVAIGIGLVSNEVGFILGESIRDQAVLIMPWITIAALMNGFINLYVYQAYVLAKKLNVMAAIMVIPVLVNCGLNMVLIPIYGLYGAVLSTLGAYGVGLILSIIGARKIFTLPIPIVTLVKCSIACFAMAVIVLLLPLEPAWPDVIKLCIKAGVGAFIYGVSLYILNPADVRKFIRER